MSQIEQRIHVVQHIDVLEFLNMISLGAFAVVTHVVMPAAII